jgi:hypothetical protein
MNSPSVPRKRRTIEIVAVGVFIAINVIAPFAVGELYPFTVSPMFRDQPKQYCTYQLFDDDGNKLELEPYGLHLVYDGNPPGLGMGIEAAPTLHPFGEVPDIETVEQHVLGVVRRHDSSLNCIRICQKVVCCNGTRPEAEVRESTISLARPGAE